MKLSIGIVGLPNVGKSTLFKLLTKAEVNIANYPFCTIDPNVGVVTVPDERVEKLTALSKSAKKIPAIVEFYDIAGLVKGANKGEGLGNKFLSHIREVKAIVHVLRCFGGSDIIHVENSVNPLRDLETINTELVLKDMETLEKHMEKVAKDARGGKKEAAQELKVLEDVKKKLGANQLVPEFEETPFGKNLQLLASKRQIYLLNGAESDASEELKKKIASLGGAYIIANLADDPSASSGQEPAARRALDTLIAKAYEVLNLISFFTTGEDETRAWTIEKGMKAPQAAGVIHTDFEKKFIRAEVINWQKLMETGGWTQAKSKGLLRLEGKEYVMQDGDVMEVRHG